MYSAADTMNDPAINGVDPADWWRTLICFAYYTGLRVTDATVVGVFKAFHATETRRRAQTYVVACGNLRLVDALFPCFV